MKLERCANSEASDQFLNLNQSEKQMTEEALVLRHDDEGVTTLTMNRPQARNALSQGMLRAMLDAFIEVSTDETARVVILAGAGPGFCAGHDLKEIKAQNYSRNYTEQLFADCAELMQTIIRLPKPVIAQVHGIATAAGAQLVASCDLAISSQEARYATPGVNIGLFCSTPMVALSRNLSNKHAMQMLLTGDLIDAQNAYRMGLVNEVVDAEQLERKTMELARKLASKSPLTVAIGKEAYYRQAELPLSEAYDYTKEVMVRNLEARDAQEGISAFIEKRHPVWCGK
jgi:enoyl-CoA hydratase/carnithine racemase